MRDASPTAVGQYLHRLASTAATDHASDAVLVARFAAGRDESAFAALVSRHGPLVRRVCQRVLADADAADDAFQATFLVLARKAGSIGQGNLLANWLYGVAVRVASHARADAARRRAREAQAALRSAADPLAEVSARELCAALDEELVRLPDRYRLPLLLCCVEGRTRDEVARELHWSVRTLARRLEEGRELLRARLNRRGITLPAALLAGGVVASAPSAAVSASAIAAAVSAGRGTPAAVPARIAALADAVARDQCLSRRVLAVVLLTTLSVAGSAAALTYYARGTAKPAEPPPAHPGRPAAAAQADALPPGAAVRFGTTRLRHQHTVSSLSFSRDGRLLASGSWDETCRVWDFASGRELRLFEAGAPTTQRSTRAVSSVGLSPDGRLLAAGDMDRGFTVWDVETGAQVTRRADLENTVLSLAFAPDGRSLASTSHAAVRVWDTATWAERWRVGIPKGGVRQVTYSPNGSLVATLNEDGTAEVLEASSGKLRDRFSGAKLRALFLPDDRTLVTAVGGGKVALRDTQLQREVRRIDAAPEGEGIIALDSGGRLLAYAQGSTAIHLIDVATGKTLRTCRLPENDHGFTALAFSPDGKRLVSSGYEKMIRVWDVASAKEIEPADGHTGEVKQVALGRDRSVITAGEDGRIITWDGATGRARHIDQVIPQAAAVAIAPGGNLAVVAVRNEVRVWDLPAHRQSCVLAGHQGPVVAVALSPNGQTAASASWQDHTIRLWDVTGGAERIRITLPAPNGVNYGDCPIVFTPDGKTLISGSADRTNDALYFWDAATGKELRRVKRQVARLALSPDGRWLASVGWDKRVRLWDVAAAAEVRDWAAGGGALAFSPDGRLLATGGTDGAVRLWEVSTGLERRRFVGHRSGGSDRGTFAAGVSALTFSADGRMVYSGGGDTTTLAWEVYQSSGPPADRDALWAGLADLDAAKAHAAMGGFLSDAKSAVGFLKARLVPVERADSQQVARLIADLDSPTFTVRERASHTLERMGEGILPALAEKHLAPSTAEGRKRLQVVRDSLQSSTPPADLRRSLRAVEVLEHIGTPEAREVIRALSLGVPQARLTRDAKTAAERLTAR